MKAILFDFDGTIADTAPGIVATMAETFRQMNLPIPKEKAMRQTIGVPLKQALQGLNDLSEKRAQEAFDIYCVLFKTIEVNFTRIFPHVAETLEHFQQQGIRMAIVTSRNLESLEVILERFHLIDYFEILLTNNDLTKYQLRPKPAPDMVLALLDRMHLNSNDAIVVGDTTFDIGMGNSAGCHTVAVTFGNHSREQILSSSPSFVIDDFAELLRLT